MVIDVSSILKEFGGRIDISDEIEIPKTEVYGCSYSFAGPVNVKGSVTNNGETLVMKAECTGVMSTQCARCLRDIDVPIMFLVEETLVQGEEMPEDFEDVIVFEGHTVSLDEIVVNNFIMNVSSRYLCKEDCKGLCTSCGADLNEGECGCNNEVIDPRWAALAEMIKKND